MVVNSFLVRGVVSRFEEERVDCCRRVFCFTSVGFGLFWFV